MYIANTVDIGDVLLVNFIEFANREKNPRENESKEEIFLTVIVDFVHKSVQFLLCGIQTKRSKNMSKFFGSDVATIVPIECHECISKL